MPSFAIPVYQPAFQMTPTSHLSLSRLCEVVNRIMPTSQMQRQQVFKSELLNGGNETWTQAEIKNQAKVPSPQQSAQGMSTTLLDGICPF